VDTDLQKVKPDYLINNVARTKLHQGFSTFLLVRIHGRSHSESQNIKKTRNVRVNVTLRRVRITIVAVGKQYVYYIF
jgi:hypothetical protein